MRPANRRVEVIFQFGLFDGGAPDTALQAADQVQRCAFKLDAATGQNGHARAQVGDIFDDVGGQDDDHILADLGQQVQEAVALFGVETGGGFIDDDQLRIADEGLRNAETLAHTARETGNGFFADIPQIDLIEQGLDRVLTLLAAPDALEDGHVVQHVIGRNARINAEILRQIAKGPAQHFRFFDDVEFAEFDAARRRRLQGGNGPHQGGLARPVWAQQAEHAAWNL